MLVHLGVSFADYLGNEHAATAIEMLRDRRETVKREILERIRRAKAFFDHLSKEELTRRNDQSKIVFRERPHERSVHREIKCPACGSPAVMTGEIVGRGPVRIDERNTAIEREVRVLPTKLRCPHCELKLDGFQEMRQAGLGSVYTVDESEDPIEFFGIDPSDYIDPDEFIRQHFGPEYDNE